MKTAVLHLVLFAVHAGAQEPTLTGTAAARRREVQDLVQAQRHNEAKAKLKQTLAGMVTTDQSARAEVLGELGEVYLHWGRHNEAIGAYEEATELLEGLYGRKDPRFGVAADKLADAHMHLGHYSEAVPLYRQLLANMRSGLMGLSHPGKPSLAVWNVGNPMLLPSHPTLPDRSPIPIPIPIPNPNPHLNPDPHPNPRPISHPIPSHIPSHPISHHMRIPYRSPYLVIP